jgi:hypothetical protein
MGSVTECRNISRSFEKVGFEQLSDEYSSLYTLYVFQ